LKLTDDFKEFAWNYIEGQSYGTFTASAYTYISRIKKLSEKYPDKIQILYTNDDGSIYGHADKSCFKFVAPKSDKKSTRKMTEEQKKNLLENLEKARIKRRQNKMVTDNNSNT
jgi:hypothetical protein